MRFLARAHAAACAAFFSTAPLSGQDSRFERIIDFDPDAAASWYVVNDGVMGGRSSSTLRPRAEGGAVFEGVLSLEDNGGFASVRTRLLPGALVGVSHVVLRVRGDGSRYQLRLRPGSRLDGVAFAAGFDTVADQWITVRLPLDAFEPTFRGYRPRGAGPLDPARVGQLGIMLTDKQEGRFRLDVDWIGVDRVAGRR